ncbi:hypothetical protein D081_1809 [Anaerovibrio sp. JC8]|uniref:hypothetical protein n=1 Tax=Anaerovibrio sp. JC8 TaxID=1240085 RepID=UPI000A0CA8EB|nr:hypothetical protein [Anaerovibrio sp. JC8]ORT99659.1 hypothetical protein D081_1809 [Anaerovibrio sp. JC8]
MKKWKYGKQAEENTKPAVIQEEPTKQEAPNCWASLEIEEEPTPTKQESPIIAEAKQQDPDDDWERAWDNMKPEEYLTPQQLVEWQKQEAKRAEEATKPAVIAEPQEQGQKYNFPKIDPATLSEEERESRRRAGVPLDHDLQDYNDGWDD